MQRRGNEELCLPNEGRVRRQKGAPLLTVNQTFGVIVTSPEVGPQVRRSRVGGEGPSPHPGDTGSPRRLLGSLLLPASVRGLAGWCCVAIRPVRAPTLCFCFSAALLLGSAACGGKSVHFRRPRNGRGPVSPGPQSACQKGSRGLKRHFDWKHAWVVLQMQVASNMQMKTFPLLQCSDARGDPSLLFKGEVAGSCSQSQDLRVSMIEKHTGAWKYCMFFLSENFPNVFKTAV